MQVKQAQNRFRLRRSPPRLSERSSTSSLSNSHLDSVHFQQATERGARDKKNSHVGRAIGAGVLAALGLTGTVVGVASHVATQLPTCQEQAFPINFRTR
ncbi:MAG TPA: hypothetical protein EYO33_18995 [Phycisphaerales bacterium]|nr:hypothetical protein [Phycisphaerales bacterium]